MNEVYLITNKVNGKRYVGITCRGYQERFKEHMHDAFTSTRRNCILHNAIRKYGPENFEVKLLESDVPDDQAEAKEKYYIAQQKSYYRYQDGYNMTEGGGGVVGYHHSGESRAKISNALKGHKFPESRNKKIQEAMIGREYKQEWRSALSQSRIGRFKKDENPFYGKHHSEHTKEIISNTNSKHKVECIDPSTQTVIHVFKNQSDAGRWVSSQGITSAAALTCAGRIGEVCRHGTLKWIAYGYHWRFEEGQSTNCSEEDELPHEAQTTVEATR